MARKVLGLVILCLSEVLSLIMFAQLVLLHYSSGGSQHSESRSLTWLFRIPPKYHSYFDFRSRYALAAYAFSLLFAQSVGRAINVYFGLVLRHRTDAYGPGHASIEHFIHEVCVALVFSCICSSILLRAWRLHVRHVYYVQLNNLGWAKIMDPSLEHSLSFYVKYKALLTSDITVIALLLCYVLFVGSLTAAFLKHHVLTNCVIYGSTAVCCILAMLLLSNVPETSHLKRKELFIVSGIMLSAIVFEGVGLFVGTGSQWRLYFAMWELCTTLMVFAMWQVSFWWLPHLVCATAAASDAHMSAMQLKHMTSNASKLFLELHILLCDADTVVEFMNHCCERMCAENLVALFEIKEYKTQLRNVFTQTSQSHTSDDSDHTSLFSTAKLSQKLALSAHIDEDWTRWDLDFSVNLSQLGCRSSILNDATDARCKAQAICQKYFEWDSEFALTVSSEHRNKVLGLVGDGASVKLESESLVFVFDEAIHDIFDNLYDAMYTFSKI